MNLKVIHTAFRFILLDITTSKPYLGTWKQLGNPAKIKAPRMGATFDSRDAFLNGQIPTFICEKQLN